MVYTPQWNLGPTMWLLVPPAASCWHSRSGVQVATQLGQTATDQSVMTEALAARWRALLEFGSDVTSRASWGMEAWQQHWLKPRLIDCYPSVKNAMEQDPRSETTLCHSIIAGLAPLDFAKAGTSRYC